MTSAGMGSVLRQNKEIALTVLSYKSNKTGLKGPTKLRYLLSGCISAQVTAALVNLLPLRPLTPELTATETLPMKGGWQEPLALAQVKTKLWVFLVKKVCELTYLRRRRYANLNHNGD